MNNPYLNRAAKKGGIGHGRVSEERVAKSLAARLQPASGAMRGAKSDSRLTKDDQKYQIESKATIHDTMGLEYGWLRKITSEALSNSAIPALTISFVDGQGKGRPQGDWVAIPLWAFHQLTEK